VAAGKDTPGPRVSLLALSRLPLTVPSLVHIQMSESNRSMILRTEAETGTSGSLDQLEVARLQAHFLRFDPQGVGQMCQRDVDGLLRSLNKTLSETQLAEILTLAGVAGDPDGAIYFDQFLEVWKSTMQVTQNDMSVEKQLRLAFTALDKAGTGKIHENSFRQLMRQMKTGMDQDLLDELIRELDVEGVGQITYNDFKRVLMPGSK